MKSKGFTLIELLAVIVILAIIALIATPIILGIIDDARKSSGQESVNMYARAVQQAAARYQLKNPSSSLPSGIYKMSNNGKLLELESDSNIKLEVEFDGSEIECAKVEIKEDGKVVLLSCKVDGNGNYNYDEDSNGSSVCTVQPIKQEFISSEWVEEPIYPSDIIISDTVNLITCGSESFYEMSNDGTKITMLSQNLLSNTSPYKQTEITSSALKTQYVETSSESSPNLITQYLNVYEEYLKSDLNLNSAKVRLMTDDEVESYGAESSGGSFTFVDTPDWILNPEGYWLSGSADVMSDDYSECWLYEDCFFYVRPVIEIFVDELN